MQDKTAIGNNENANTPSKAFREYIEALVEEVVINGEPFEAQKKWLHKNSEAEGVSYETIESNLNDLFEAIKELERNESKIIERSVRFLAKECYLSEALVNKLIENATTRRRQKEEVERREKEERERKAQEEAERKAREEQDRIVKEKAQWQKKLEAERKAKEEAERLALAAEQARKEAERKAREERERKEAERKAEEERERRARKEAERKAREEAERETSVIKYLDVDEAGNVFCKDNDIQGKLLIPSTLKGKRVTGIRSRAFSGCSGLTSIVIPDSVTEIGEGAFEGCTGLTSIVIPNSVTEIETGAFRGCESLTSIVIPKSVMTIGSGLFKGCTGLKSVKLSKGFKCWKLLMRFPRNTEVEYY